MPRYQVYLFMMRYRFILVLNDLVIVIISNEFLISIFLVFRFRGKSRWSYYWRFVYTLSWLKTRRTGLLILFVIRFMVVNFGLLFYSWFLVFDFVDGFLFLVNCLFKTLKVLFVLLLQLFGAWGSVLKCIGLFFLLRLSQHLIINLFLPRKPLNLLKSLFTSL